MAVTRTSPATVLETWPTDDAGRRAVLARVAAGQVRLGRAALKAIEAEGVAGVYRNLRVDVAAGVAVAAHERHLYMAAAMWERNDRRGLWRALAGNTALAAAVVGYGTYLLGGAEGDPLPAWRPMGAWVMGSGPGWETFRGRLVLKHVHARRLEVLERATLPWGRRLRVLEFLGGEVGQAEAQTLLELCARLGGVWQRIAARGAAARAREVAAARRQASADAAATRPAYPELLPLSDIRDVTSATDRAPEP